MTNRKLHTRFRLVPKINDLEGPLHTVSKHGDFELGRAWLAGGVDRQSLVGRIFLFVNLLIDHIMSINMCSRWWGQVRQRRHYLLLCILILSLQPLSQCRLLLPDHRRLRLVGLHHQVSVIKMYLEGGVWLQDQTI